MGSLAFVDSPDLSSISFPSLTQIVGALDFAGAFNSVSMPSLTDVRGGSNVQTTSTNTTICDLFNQAHSVGVIKGVNTCLTNKANPDTNPSATSGGTSSTSTSGSSTSNVAIAFGPSAPLTGLSALFAAIFFL